MLKQLGLTWGIAIGEPTSVGEGVAIFVSVGIVVIGIAEYITSEDEGKSESEEEEKTVEDLIEESEPGRETKGKTENREKSGGWKEALDDFEDLAPDNVKDRSDDEKRIKTGELSGDRKVNVRDTSSSGEPTLEIQYPNGTRIKIRYQ